MRFLVAVLSSALAWSLIGTPAVAQKGMGDREGVARQAEKPKVVALSGKVLSVESGPCENTTGRATVGTHLMLKSAQGKELNVHLGPEAAVEPVARRLSKGMKIDVKAFRTDKMPKAHFVAQSIRIGEETLELRDDALRPVWAGGAWNRGRNAAAAPQRPGPGKGRGQQRGWGRGGGKGYGPGYGRGYGRGWGRGGWNCPAWNDAPAGRGYGRGPAVRGPGYGRRGPAGQRGGRGGYGRGQGGRGPIR
jgi:hypothetical protein